MTDPLREAARQKQLVELAERTGHRFANLGHLDRALRHASTGNETKLNYERLEFLGDAILGFLVAEELFTMEPEVPEGRLTETRANLVSRRPLASIATKLQLVSGLDTGKSLQEHAIASERILSDLVEAVLAAVYLDGGMDAARKFVHEHVLALLPEALQKAGQGRDSKSRLLHMAQKHQLGQPTYLVVETKGLQHEQEFRVEVRVADRALAEGTGRSKQAAEKEAAALGLDALEGALQRGEIRQDTERERP